MAGSAASFNAVVPRHLAAFATPLQPGTRCLLCRHKVGRLPVSEGRVCAAGSGLSTDNRVSSASGGTSFSPAISLLLSWRMAVKVAIACADNTADLNWKFIDEVIPRNRTAGGRPAPRLPLGSGHSLNLGRECSGGFTPPCRKRRREESVRTNLFWYSALRNGSPRRHLSVPKEAPEWDKAFRP